MASSPWNKKGVFGRKKKMAQPQQSQHTLPRHDEEVVLNLGDATLRFQNGHWSSEGGGGGGGSGVDKFALEDLQMENDALREKNNMLEFKVQLLLDMLTVSSLDLDRLARDP